MYQNNKKVDVVVPVYKGQRYITGIIGQLGICQARLDKAVSISLILVNDAPDDRFREDWISNSIGITAVETEQNRGIHGARVRGLSFCTGDYVVFLDQDDWIAPNYFESQLTKLGDADAVVCRARENGREVYNTTVPFAKAIDFENMVSAGNTIVSPGQVLMRRKAVPDMWKQNILKNNGVDDWFLWLCMMNQECRFVLNDNILFEHRIEGTNSSWDSQKMLLSEIDMLEVFKTQSVLDSAMLERLEVLIASEQQRYINILEKYRQLFLLYDRWMDLESRLGSISDYLHSQKVGRVAIYGMGYIGRQLSNRFKDSNVTLIGAIDRNAGFIDADVRIVRPEEFEQDADLVIVTVLENAEDILQKVRCQTDARVVTIYQLLGSWEQGGEIQYE